VVSYELVAAMNEGEQEQANSIGGVQTIDNRYKDDPLYNPFPYNVSIHSNRFLNKHWFPTMQSDIGKLLIMKSMFNPPDILFDGIADPNRAERKICIGDNGEITFINLDAANDFKELSKDVTLFNCK
jgi:hypothetical protein